MRVSTLAAIVLSGSFSVAQTCSPEYGQCGGLIWTGATCCVAGTVCQYQNAYYYQCLVSTAATTSSTITTSTTTTTTTTKPTTTSTTTTTTSKPTTTTTTTTKPTTTTITTTSPTTTTTTKSTTPTTTTTTSPTTTTTTTKSTTTTTTTTTAATATATSTGTAPYTWSNVEIGGGGFVSGISFSPIQQNLIYSRTDIGGCYRWDSTTGLWVQLLNWVSAANWSDIGVDSLAPDPVNVNRVYILVGTYTNSWSTTNGKVFRSDDQGATWDVQTSLSFKVGGNMPGRGMGERLAIDPNNNNIVYLGARSGNGLWKSTNAGVSFSQVTQFPVVGSYLEVAGSAYQGDKVGIVWTIFDSTTGSSGTGSSTIYVGAAENTTSSIYISKDSGTTWAALAGQPIGFLPIRAKLNNKILYVTYSNDCGPYVGTLGDVWKYNTTSAVWTLISPVASTTSGAYFGYGGLGIDAQNPDTIMVAAVNSWWPDGQIYRSLNGGSTWSALWEWTSYPSMSYRSTWDTSVLPWANLGAAAAPPVPAYGVGWMMQSLEIDPFNSNKFLYGTGLSMYGSTNLLNWDNPNTTFTLKSFVIGQEETAVIDLAAPPSGVLLYSALGDVCGFAHTSLTTVPSTVMTQPVFTSGSSVDYGGSAPAYVARAGSATTNHIGFSTSSGSSWFQASSEPSGAASGQVAVSANGLTTLWAPGGTATGVYYTTTFGSSWTQSGTLPTGSYIASDRVNATVFYAFSSGTAYYSTNSGQTFTASVTNLPTTTSSNRPLKAVPGAAGHVWLSTGTNLYKSTDGANTFTALGVQAVAVGFGVKASSGTYPAAVYISGTIGTQAGLYRSDDGGNTWVRINDDTHQYGSTNFAIDGDKNVYGRVFVGTNGLGVVYGTAD
ncbi:hypothetical protein HK100_012647 [Physocladia obscura]|uniref:CBM1 domain-containing protein n=1 Tax=Physocladia obscura TaxID=109957 RepID=A0AAD5T0G5_9FUNG|nr:hypothetical protein HK100_012647 [Physocladia obscura]